AGFGALARVVSPASGRARRLPREARPLRGGARRVRARRRDDAKHARTRASRRARRRVRRRIGRIPAAFLGSPPATAARLAVGMVESEVGFVTPRRFPHAPSRGWFSGSGPEEKAGILPPHVREGLQDLAGARRSRVPR